MLDILANLNGPITKRKVSCWPLSNAVFTTVARPSKKYLRARRYYWRPSDLPGTDSNRGPQSSYFFAVLLSFLFFEKSTKIGAATKIEE